MFKQYLLIGIAWLWLTPCLAELRDPTRPANRLPQQDQVVMTSPTGEAILELTEIRISGITRRAIINGELVRTGQSLADGTQVLHIQPHRVIVRQNGVNKKLILVPTVTHPVK